MSTTFRAAVLPFAAFGVACVIAGGLVAAVTAPAPTEHASWSAAYLVLVAGVAQIGLGAGQALLAAGAPSGRLLAAEFAAFNAGNAAVIAGTVLRVPPVVDAGGVLLVVSLALLLHAVRGSGATGVAPGGPDVTAAMPSGPDVTAAAPGGSVSAGMPGRRWLLLGYRLLVAMLLVSIPVGLVLAGLRSG